MKIVPRLTYNPTWFRRLTAPEEPWLRTLAPAFTEGRPAPVLTPEAVADPWDGRLAFPSPGRAAGYARVLAETIRACRPELEARRVRLDSYVDPDKIRLAQKTWRRTHERVWIAGRFQLGRKYGALAPTDAVLKLPAEEIALDPASVLIILTVAVMEHGTQALQPMWIDCPGAQYDPEGKKKFADCPRWNVSTDPSPDDVAFLSLDWNWEASLRARANHGSATMLLEP